MPGLPKISGVKDETKFDQLRKATYPGQAHWGGSGPKGKTCRECANWVNLSGEHNGYFSDGSGLKPVRCVRYFGMTGQQGAPVPHEARACREFVAAKDPPKAYD